MPLSSTNSIREMIGRHLMMQKNHGALDSLAGVSANSTRKIVHVLKKGTNFGPQLFS